MKTIIQRAKAPTPPFFKKLRNIGIGLTTIAGVVLTAPVSLPATMVSVAGYIAVAGGVASAISQLAVKDAAAPVIRLRSSKQKTDE